MERIHNDEIEVWLTVKAKEKDDCTPFQKLKSYGILNHYVSKFKDKKEYFLLLVAQISTVVLKITCHAAIVRVLLYRRSYTDTVKGVSCVTMVACINMQQMAVCFWMVR
jgi:hypothetical protein